MVKEGIERVYLYVACYNNSIQKEKEEAFIAVTKAMLYTDVAIKMENLGDHAIIFTSIVDIKVIKNKLNNNNVNYILVDLSLSYDLESIFCFLPDSKIDIIKKINKEEFSNDKIYLKKGLDNSVVEEKFELSAALKKIL